MLDEFFSTTNPTELLQRAYFGRDDDTWTTDGHENKTYGAFNPNRDYFTFNGYGNLVSSNYKDYSAHLDQYAIESMSENRAHIDTIEDNDELSALFDELEEVNQ
jgi:dipeptidase